MAVESDPGTKPAPAAKAAPPAEDTEKASLKAELEKERREREQERAQIAAALQDPEVVRNLHARVAGSQQQTQENEPEDESALVDRKELKRALDTVSRQAVNVVAETSGISAKQIRQANIRAKRAEDPKFSKYEKEVVALLDQLPPMQAADPDVIENTYKVVRSSHLDEEAEEMRARIREEERERLRARGVDLEDDDEPIDEPEEEDEPVRERGRAAKPAGAMSRGAAAPSAATSGSRSLGRSRNENRPQLTRDQRAAAEIFELTPEEFVKYGDPKWKPDLMGSNGRHRF